MLKAIYFALHFAMIILGMILAIHFDPVIGLLISGIVMVILGGILFNKSFLNK